jgi:hypothetical protein
VRLIYLLRRDGKKNVRVNVIRIKASFLQGNSFYNHFNDLAQNRQPKTFSSPNGYKLLVSNGFINKNLGKVPKQKPCFD